MNEKLKKKLEDLYVDATFLLTRFGGMSFTMFVLLDEKLVPLIYPDVDEEGYSRMNINDYVDYGYTIATQMGADAVIIIVEQYLVEGKKEDDDLLKYISNGQLKVSEHPDSKLYLSLIYTDKSDNYHALNGLIQSDPSGTKYVSDQQWSIWKLDNIKTPSYLKKW